MTKLIKTLISVCLLLLVACDTIDKLTPTITPAVIPTSTPTATPTIVPTPTLLPFLRAEWDTNTFEIASPEWMAWNYYDAMIKYLDYAKKTSTGVGLTAEEQMAVWKEALEKYGVDGE